MICQFRNHVPQNVTNAEGAGDILCLRCGKLQSQGWGNATYDGFIRGLRLAALAGGTTLFTSLTVADMSLRSVIALTGVAVFTALGGRTYEGARDERKAAG